MAVLYIITNILAIALPSLRTSPLLIRIAAIVLLYAAAVTFIVVYIQSIVSGIGVFSELFSSETTLKVVYGTNFLSVHYCAIEEICPSLLLLSSLLPIKPHQLKKVEREEMKLSENFKQILYGLILGDLNIRKITIKSNPHINFQQGIVDPSGVLTSRPL